jgi:hypothetical protein
VAANQQQDQQQPTSPFDRLSHRADNMAKTSAALKKVADAGAPLYQSLDDQQKGRFMMLARILRPHHRMHAFNDRDGGRDGQGDGRGWGHDRHFGQNDGGPGHGLQNLSDGDGGQGSGSQGSGSQGSGIQGSGIQGLGSRASGI